MCKEKGQEQTIPKQMIPSISDLLHHLRNQLGIYSPRPGFLSLVSETKNDEIRAFGLEALGL